MSYQRIEDIGCKELEIFSGIRDALIRDYPSVPGGLFIGESPRVIERALDSGCVPYSVCSEGCMLEKMEPLIARMRSLVPDMPVYVATHEQYQALTGFKVTRSALAAFHRPPEKSVAEVVSGARRVAVLEDITNYTNIGAIFRSAAALGIDAVLITPSCHDPLYRRASRVSMGTVFQVPWTRISNVQNWAAEGVPLLHELGFKVAALALSDDSIPLHSPKLAACDKLALVLGTEGDGLSKSTIAACDYTVKIPMEHEVDSLNVAAASAVAFWELRTVNRQ